MKIKILGKTLFNGRVMLMMTIMTLALVWVLAVGLGGPRSTALATVSLNGGGGEFKWRVSLNGGEIYLFLMVLYDDIDFGLGFSSVF